MNQVKFIHLSSNFEIMFSKKLDDPSALVEHEEKSGLSCIELNNGCILIRNKDILMYKTGKLV